MALADVELVVNVIDVRAGAKMRWQIFKPDAAGRVQVRAWTEVLEKIENRAERLGCEPGRGPKSGLWTNENKTKTDDIFEGRIVRIQDRHWFTFGKYAIGQPKSISVQDVALQDRKYINWLLDAAQDFPKKFKRGLAALVKMVDEGKWTATPAPKLESLPFRKSYTKRPRGGPMY